jgi:hypothetical protein
MVLYQPYFCLNPLKSAKKKILVENTFLKYVTLVLLTSLVLFSVHLKQVRCRLLVGLELLYILEYNTHPGFGDLLNGKKLVLVSNVHISFHRPMPIWQLTE